MAFDPHVISDCMRMLKNADPRAYEKFLRVLDAYVSELTVAVTVAPVADILIAQGRAQQGIKFFQLFTELREPTKPSA
jgi:hypothetical protein